MNFDEVFYILIVDTILITNYISMFNQQPNDALKIIAQLPPKIIIHDMAFDDSGTRIALACSDKTVKIYAKNNNQWKLESFIKLVGAAGWKVKWANQQIGVLIAVCSLDRIITVYQWGIFKRQEKPERYQWCLTQSISNFSVEDFKFAPGNNYGPALGIVDSPGEFQVKMLSSLKPNTSTGVNMQYKPSQLGLNCFSWYKKTFDNFLILAFGSKSHQTTPLRALEGFKDSLNSQSLKISPANSISFACLEQSGGFFVLELVYAQGFKEQSAVNDISWAHNNGRSYNMLGVATDYSLKIYEVAIKEPKEVYLGEKIGNKKVRGVQMMKMINLTENASYRICWNLFGTFISVSQKKKVKMFKSICRGRWVQFKQIQDK